MACVMTFCDTLLSTIDAYKTRQPYTTHPTKYHFSTAEAPGEGNQPKQRGTRCLWAYLS